MRDTLRPGCGILWAPPFERAAAEKTLVPARLFEHVVMKLYDIGS
jgi:hypothetical protein